MFSLAVDGTLLWIWRRPHRHGRPRQPQFHATGRPKQSTKCSGHCGTWNIRKKNKVKINPLKLSVPLVAIFFWQVVNFTHKFIGIPEGQLQYSASWAQIFNRKNVKKIPLSVLHCAHSGFPNGQNGFMLQVMVPKSSKLKWNNSKNICRQFGGARPTKWCASCKTPWIWKIITYLSLNSALLRRKSSVKFCKSSACCSWALDKAWVKSDTGKIKGGKHQQIMQIDANEETTRHTSCYQGMVY